MDGYLSDNATVERVVGVVGYNLELSELSIPTGINHWYVRVHLSSSLLIPLTSHDWPEALSFRIGRSGGEFLNSRTSRSGSHGEDVRGRAECARNVGEVGLQG